MQKKVIVVLVCVLGLALSSVAQEAQGPMISQVVWVLPKAGQQQQLEAAAKQHMEWHRQQNDTWTWNIWMVMSGENTGSYYAVSPNHRWADFDGGVSREADAAHAIQTIGPYIERETNSFHVQLENLSRPPTGDTAYPLAVVNTYQVRWGKAEDFNHFMQRAHEAIGKTNWPVHYLWYALANGGEHPSYGLVILYENFADMTPPEKPFDKMLEEAFGAAEARRLLRTFTDSIRSVRSELVRYRADLSYVPEGGM